MKNLLVGFLEQLQPEQLKILSTSVKTRGQQLSVWRYVLKAIAHKSFNKKTALQVLDMSSSHFDKVCSELLQKCYDVLVPQKGFDLLSFLNNHPVWSKHFYNELKQQLKNLNTSPSQEAKTFLQNCIRCFVDIPVINRNKTVFKKICKQYVLLATPATKKEHLLFVGCCELQLEISFHFASDKAKEHTSSIGKQIEHLFTLISNSTAPNVVFEYYALCIQWKHATHQYSELPPLIEKALQFLPETDIQNIAHLKLKKAEALYYLSHFNDSFLAFKALLTTNEETYHNIGYFYTKYLQVCLITQNMDVAKWILDYKKQKRGHTFEETIMPRDIVSYAKYHLLNEEYDLAHYFIRLGYAKNPKAKYLQYEIELRILEVAYFYFTANTELFFSLCKKNIAFLHSKGYGIKTSEYPLFFVVAKAILEHKTTQRPFTKREQKAMQEFQEGSKAVYGRILQKMMSHLLHF